MKLPHHISLIPDGNRRWARINGMPYELGYRKAVDNIFNFVEWCGSLNIPYLTVWAFSTENFERDPQEKEKLFRLLNEKANEALDSNRFDDYGIRVNFLGNLGSFPGYLQNIMKSMMDKTRENTRHTLSIMLGYGGRHEILNAVRTIAEDVRNGKLSTSGIDEKLLSSRLYTAELPDPDMIIRTAESRLSGFMPWQSVYSELYFSNRLWPEFSVTDLEDILKDYSKRERRFGK